MLPRARSILRNLEGLGRSHEGRDIAHRADVDLAAGQECHGARNVDDEAALDAAEDDTVDAFVVGERFLQLRPGLFTARFFAAQRDDPVTILVTLDKDVDLVARLNLQLLSRHREFLQRNPALGLQPDVDHGGIVLDDDHGAFDHLAFETFPFAQRFLKQLGEILLDGQWGLFGGRLRSFGSHRSIVLFIQYVSGPTGCIRWSSVRLNIQPVVNTPRRSGVSLLTAGWIVV